MTILIEEIASASEGLLFPSETDAPLRPFLWTEAMPFSIAALRQAQGYDADTPIAELDVDEFFGPATRSYDWHGTDEQQRVQRFRSLLSLLKARLRNLKAYKAGASGTIDVFVVGQAEDGSFAGISTQVVET
jgi:hypothetical protein